ncbi:NUDIX domain-containing protein [Candidatus Kaiserbacteria bacterium]|nr:NUDIX domain-containing protein [Candidatus Kaiserbacteria bacterium]
MKRIATIIVRNNAGDFYVHQRRSDKKTFPDYYGLGAGGHIEDGETPEEGAARELQEETGLTGELKQFFHFEYTNGDESYPVYAFEIQTNQEPSVAETEWQWCGWMSKDEVDALLEENKLCPDTAIFYRKYRTDCI